VNSIQILHSTLQAVKVNLHVECKCHGVSGSCTMKTCWKTLPAFRQIGDSLMRKYSRARPVMAVEVGSRPGRRSKNLQLVLRRTPSRGQQLLEKKRVPRRSDLVFLQESPNYCERDPATGSLGTVGRHCNRTSRGEISGVQPLVR
jgi:wingless-type MMTV integration site family protein 7